MSTHPAILSREKAALVVIDFQEKLVPSIWKKDEIIRNTQLMIQAAALYNIPIILTEHYPKGLGKTIPGIMEVLPEYNPCEKVVFSAFHAEDFGFALNKMEIETLILTGIESHICVSQTAHEALEEGFWVHVISDAVSSRTEANHNVGIEKMRGSGVVISSTEMALYEIQKRAANDEFKELLKLVK